MIIVIIRANNPHTHKKKYIQNLGYGGNKSRFTHFTHNFINLFNFKTMNLFFKYQKIKDKETLNLGYN